MADQRSADCNINIAMNRPENCATESTEKSNVFRRLNKIPTLKLILRKFAKEILQLGKDDPRKIMHAIKVGLALSVVSLFYLTDKLFHGVGRNAIWAIMTVVVVFEFTAGATLSKGLNRAIGTLLAGTFGVVVGLIADMFEGLGEGIIICISCFILGAGATYLRFLPNIKRKYDYGVLIFLLTFNMIAVSGFRFDNGFRVAYERLATIAIGFAICLVISLIVFPIWAGEDLHKSIILKIDGLSNTIEGCVLHYLKDPDVLEPGEIAEEQIRQGYRDVLDSKTSEESLAAFASWEPRHGKFRFRYPWKQYVKVGGALRHMAYSVVGLHGCLRSEFQAPHFTIAATEKPFTKVGFQVAHVLRQLAESIRSMEQCPPSQILMQNLHDAVQELNTAFCLQSKLFHISQPLCCTDPCISTAKTTNLNVNPTQTEQEPDPEPIQIFKDVKQNVIYDQDQHQSNSELSSEELDSPARRQYIYNERKQSLSAVTGRLSMKERYGVEFAEALPLAAFASLIMEIVARLEHVIEAVHELGKLAAFKPYDCTRV